MVTKIAIIGATGSAYKRTAPALKDYADIKITAIQGRNESKLQQMCREYDIPAYFLCTKDMLEKADYDIIYIANPPFMHYDDLMLAFNYAKPVICEKPLCLNSAENYEIYKRAEEKNIPLMVAHQMRHQSAYDFIKKTVEKGVLGKVALVYAKWDYMLDTAKPSSLWKTDYVKSGGGAMNDVGIHLLDFIYGLLGNPLRVYGAGNSGSIGTVFANEDAMLDYGDFACVIKCSYERENTDNEFMICGTKACIRVPEGMGEKSIKYLHIDDRQGRKTVYFKDENLYANEVTDFIRYLNNDNSVMHRITTPADALKCTEIIEMMRSLY